MMKYDDDRVLLWQDEWELLLSWHPDVGAEHVYTHLSYDRQYLVMREEVPLETWKALTAYVDTVRPLLTVTGRETSW